MGGRKVSPITNQPWHTTLSPCLWHGTQLLLNILHMALLNPLQTDIIPDIHIVCFLSTLSTDINSMAVFAESLGIRFHFLWCGARKLMKDMSRNLGCKRTEIGISYYFFSPPPQSRQWAVRYEWLSVAVRRRLSYGCDSKWSTQAQMCMQQREALIRVMTGLCVIEKQQL